MPRKQPPEGFITAGEAAKMLRVMDTIQTITSRMFPCADRGRNVPGGLVCSGALARCLQCVLGPESKYI